MRPTYRKAEKDLLFTKNVILLQTLFTLKKSVKKLDFKNLVGILTLPLDFVTH